MREKLADFVSDEPAAVSWLRGLLLVPLAYWTLTLPTAEDPWCFLDFVNLAFHEAGHLFFSPFGTTVHYLGGTLGQLLVPAILAVYFVVWQGKPFGAAFCLFWFGENLVNVARYMADARELALPLVGGGDHDWNELFYRFGLLGEESVASVASATRTAGAAGMLLGLLWAAYFVLPCDLRGRIRNGVATRVPGAARLLD